MGEFRATTTITFPHPMKGSELMEAVRATIDKEDPTGMNSLFHSEQLAGNVEIFFGLRTEVYATDQWLVTPVGRRTSGIDPNKLYPGADLVSHIWLTSIPALVANSPLSPISLADYDRQDAEQATYRVYWFGERLEEYLNDIAQQGAEPGS